VKPESKQPRLTQPIQPTFSGYAIGEQLHLALKAAHGEDLTYAQVADQIMTVRSTYHRWCRDVGVEHLRILTSLMELLTAEERMSFWGSVCRDRPSLRHPRLAHDANGIARLHAVLSKPNGITVITGPGSAATFVLTAFGIEFRRQDRSHRAVAGLSVHPPHTTIPVPGVHYLPPLTSRQEQLRLVREIWPLLDQSDAPVVLLDAVPDLVTEVLALARRKHVIMSLAQVPEWPPSRRFPAETAHHVTVSTSPHPSAPIEVKVDPLG
jgi:hypothetical protein